VPASACRQEEKSPAEGRGALGGVLQPADRTGCLSGEFEMFEAQPSGCLAQSRQPPEDAVLETRRTAEPEIGLADWEGGRSDQLAGRQPAVTLSRDKLEAEPAVARSRRLQGLQPD